MKTVVIHAKALPKTFAELNEMLELRPIGNDEELAEAGRMIDLLAVLSRRTKDQEDYLETLILLTEKYEEDEVADALDASKSSGVEALRYVMDARGMKQAELAKLLGVGASAASMIVAGDRPITAEHARKLGRHFGLNPAAFL